MSMMSPPAQSCLHPCTPDSEASRWKHYPRLFSLPLRLLCVSAAAAHCRFLLLLLHYCCCFLPHTLQALVMKALVGLCTVLYKSFPTSIQQDKAELAALKQQQTSNTSPTAAAAAAAATALGDSSSSDNNLQQQQLMMMTALQFRLGQKLLLERSTKQLIQRLQELATAKQ